MLRKFQVHPSKLYKNIDDKFLVLQKSNPEFDTGKLEYVWEFLESSFPDPITDESVESSEASESSEN